MEVHVYEISGEKAKDIKAILEAADKKDPQTGKWIINEFVTNGFKMTDARGLGIDGEANYVYIKASAEFFNRNEKQLLEAGAKKLSGPEADKVKKKFEEAQESAETGLGAIFG